MIRRALISVYDKTGIVNFAKELLKFDIEIISTGGTYNLLCENHISVKKIEQVTDFPEVLDGRVKTLHPRIFAGILSDRENKKHLEELSIHKIEEIDLLVVNLYPFEKTIEKKSVTVNESIEQIDIGGVTLLRAAAKNFKSVNVLSDPGQYNEFIAFLISTKNNISQEYSLELARKAFETTSSYDKLIYKYYSSLLKTSEFSFYFPQTISKERVMDLRYGENPHQQGKFIKEDFDEIFNVIHGKELSYNNLLDIDAAYNLISEFENEKPAAAIIKHGNPSGVAVSNDLSSAYSKAFATDTVSPFGGIITINKKLDFKTSIDIDKLFAEIILAPDFDDDALDLLTKKKNRRLVKFKFVKNYFEYRKITGGVLYQDKNNVEVVKSELNFVTKRKATEDEIEDMLFAYKVVKHTKSNAIVFVKDKRTLAIGGGQPSRIDSTKIAVSKAKEFNIGLQNSVAASDAFFPFADGLIEIAKAGAVAVVQPGGSVRDDEVIKAADEYNLAMAFTGVRHFKH